MFVKKTYQHQGDIMSANFAARRDQWDNVTVLKTTPMANTTSVMLKWQQDIQNMESDPANHGQKHDSLRLMGTITINVEIQEVPRLNRGAL